MVAQNPTLLNDPATIVGRLLRNATDVPGLAEQVAGGGDVLNTNAAVTNANGCP